MEKTKYLALFFILFSIFAISFVFAANSTLCTKDSDCKVEFSSCNCANSCISEESDFDCTRRCLDESNYSITSCKCENNKCVGIQNESDVKCKNLYWFDNENKECGQKEFCGAYMYYGLQTFESKTQCEKAASGEKGGCVVDSDCEQSDCGTNADCIGNKFICIGGKCVNDQSNGRNAEIKIMPETASAKAIERLGELNFTIQLKEVGKGEDARVVYELEGKKEGRFLGIFKIMARVSAQVDAESGDVKVIKPWWSFLASGI